MNFIKITIFIITLSTSIGIADFILGIYLEHTQTDMGVRLKTSLDRYEYCTFNPILGYDGIPSHTGLFFNKVVSQNEHGNRIVTGNPPAYSRHIIFSGDSQTWGFGVDDEGTLASQLQMNLNDNIYYVENFGVSGYGPDQSYLKYMISKARHNSTSKIVIFTLFLENDFDEASSSTYWGVNKPLAKKKDNRICFSHIPVLRDLGWQYQDIWTRLKKSSQTVAAFLGGLEQTKFITLNIYRFLNSRALSPNIEDFLYYIFPSLLNNYGYTNSIRELICPLTFVARETNKFDLVLAILKAFKADVESDGGQFFVVLFPKKSEFESGQYDLEDLNFIRSLQQEKFLYLDTIKELRRCLTQDITSNSVWGKGNHFSAEGNQLLALLIKAHLNLK